MLAPARTNSRVDQANGLVSILVTALLPPPTPFKVFVLGQEHWKCCRNFRARLILARGFRFFAEGLLAVKYGNQEANFFLHTSLRLLESPSLSLWCCIWRPVWYFDNHPQLGDPLPRGAKAWRLIDTRNSY